MTGRDVLIDDPWSMPDYRSRCSLAQSILGHANPTDAATADAIRRALSALQGTSIEQLAEEASA